MATPKPENNATPPPAAPVPPLANTDNPLKKIGNLMKAVSDVAPILITGFLFMNTVFNYDLKALFWIAPLFFWLMLMKFLQSSMKNNEIPKSATSCSTLWGTYKSPSLSSFFIMYTLGYIAAPMPVYNDWNVVAIFMFTTLFIIDAFVRLSSDCSTMSGIALGGIGGLIIGVFMYFGLSWAGLGKFLYYSIGNSNKVYCSKPKEQNFKCYVYKNGNIISTI